MLKALVARYLVILEWLIGGVWLEACSIQIPSTSDLVYVGASDWVVGGCRGGDFNGAGGISLGGTGGDVESGLAE